MILLLVLSLAMPEKVSSQIMEIGATGGASYYIGDINPGGHFKQSKMSFGGTVRYYQNLRWAFRFQYSNINLSSSDEVAAFKPERGLAFNSKINDFAIMAEFNFFDYWTGSQRNFISPYIFAGVSFFKFNTKHPDGTELQPLMTEGVDYSTFSWSIPFGLGVKFSMTKRLGMTVEWRIHKAFTDYIDDIHGMYPEKDVVAGDYAYTDPTSSFKPGMQRGNGSSDNFGYNNDWYSVLGVTILYRFNLPKKEVCHMK